MELKKKLIKNERNAIFKTRSNENTEASKYELFEMILNNLLTFHSDKFKLIINDDGEKILHNLIINEYINITKLKDDPLITGG
jgi:hypothetical protein